MSIALIILEKLSKMSKNALSTLIVWYTVCYSISLSLPSSLLPSLSLCSNRVLRSLEK